MPNWKKVITSGSDASLNSLNVSNDITGSDALITNDLKVSGNIGIGTATPSEKLEVEGNVQADTLIATDLNDGYVPYAMNSANGLQDSSIYNDGGDIGIGTNSPSTKLEVAGNILANNINATVNIGSTASSTLAYGYPNTAAGTLIVGGYTNAGYNYQPGVISLINQNPSIGAGTDLGVLQFAGKSNATYPYVSSNIKAFTATAAGSGNSGGGIISISTSTGAAGVSPTERFRINQTGNVGIGTTSPTYKLELGSGDFNLPLGSNIRFGGQLGINKISNGKFRLYGGTGTTTNGGIDLYRWNGATYSTALRLSNTGQLQFDEYGSGTFTGTATQKLAVDSSGNVIEIPIGSGAVDGSGTANYVTKWSDADTITDTVIYDNGTNVGIGTTSPSSKLHVEGTATLGTALGRIDIATTGASITEGPALILDSRNLTLGSYDNARFYTGIKQTHTNNTTVDDTIQFICGDSERMRIASGGNVGIGTTSPSEKLEVAGNLRVSGGDIVLTNTKGIQFSDQYWEIGRNVVSTTGTPMITSNALQFISYGNSNEGYQFMDRLGDVLFELESSTGNAVFNKGNVGIGTTSPSANLDIEDASGVTVDINSSSGDGQFRFQDNGTTKWAVGRDNTQQNFVFSSSSGLDSDNVLTLAHSTGNVGIGTSSPSQKLHVDGNTLISAEKYYYVAGGGAGFGSDASGNFKIRQNGADLIFGSGSNVGIGTTSPGAKLHVHDDDGAIIRLSSNAHSDSNKIQFDALNDGTIYHSIVSNTSSGNLQIRAGDAGGGHEVNIYTDGLFAATFDHNQNLGIGTTSPASLLEISQQLSAAATIDYPYTISSRDDSNSINQTGGEGVGIKFRIAGNATTTPGDSLVGASIAAIRESSSDNDSSTGLGLFVTQNDETLDEAVRIDHDGNVGIGTTSPSRPLHVVNTSAQTVAIFDGGNNGAGEIAFTGAGTSGGTYVTIGAVGDDMSLSAGASERMRIASGGNVGIGTTSPSQKLDVAGSIRTNNQLSVFNTDLSRQTLRIKSEATTNNGLLKLSNGVNWGLLMKGYSNGPYIGSYFNGSLNITGFEDSDGTTPSAINLASFYFGGTGGGSGYLTLNGNLNVNTNKKIKIQYANSQTNGIEWNAGSKISAAITPVDTANYSRAGLGFFTGDFSDGTTDAVERMRITRAGNVGIGTTSPSRNLEISDTGDAIVRIAGDSDNDAGEVGDAVLEMTTDGGGHGWSLRSENIGGGTGDLKVSTFISQVESTKLLIDRDGNVGIGTTSPSYKLDVDETTSGNLIVSRFKHNQSGVASAMQLENRAGAANSAFDINWGLNSSGNQGTVGVVRTNLPAAGGSEMYFKTSYGEVMRLDGAGNVGIGTTSPQDTLHVEGNITGSGDININGTLSAAIKSFDIPHPTQERKRLVYGVLEGPEHAVYVRGESKEDTIILPEEWTGLVDESTITVQLTPIRNPDIYYYKNYKSNSIIVGGPEKKHYFYYVQATRKDVEPLITVQ